MTVLAIILTLIGGWLFIWATLPIKQETEVTVLTPSMMRIEKSGQGNGAAVLEERLVRLEWPDRLRIGEKASIELVFEEASGELFVIDEQGGFDNVYKDYNIMGEARFEAAGLVIEPANPRRESMPEGQPIKYKWEIRSDKTGLYTGTIWLSLRFLPLDGSPPVQVPIYVREVRLKSTGILGLSGPMARIVGGVGLVMGLGVWVMKRFTTKDTKITKNIML